MAETSTTPVSFRLHTGLRKRLNAYAEKFAITSTDVVQTALREYLASTCPSCGAARSRIAPGRTAEFLQFAKYNYASAIYLRIERNGKVMVFKGRYPRITGHRVRLDAISPGWNRGEAYFPLDDVTDWMEGTPDTDVSEWERKHPGLPVDKSWGFPEQ